MRHIQIDNDVYEFLLQNARPFVDPDPNSVLRRLLGLSTGTEVGQLAKDSVETKIQQTRSSQQGARRSKAPKANLRELTQRGLLREGESLYLIDYHGHRIDQFSATLDRGWLSYEGSHYTMSDLAQKLLSKVGFKSDSVRGPAHWVNAQGVTVKELWGRVLSEQSAKKNP